MHSIQAVLAEQSFARARAPNTLRIYRRALKRLAAHGVERTDQATVTNVYAFVEARLAQVQPQSVLVECVALFAVLSHLERTGRFERAQLERLRRLRPDVERPALLSAPHLSRQEYSDLCVVAGKGTLSELTIIVATLSGLRASELARLAWTDVDYMARVIRVRWRPDSGRIKTGRERQVPLCSDLLEALLSHPAARMTSVCGEGLVLGCKTLSYSVLSRRLERVSAKPDAPKACLNLLRHTRASWWVQTGNSLELVSQWLGNSPEVAGRYYAGLRTGWNEAADRLPAA